MVCNVGEEQTQTVGMDSEDTLFSDFPAVGARSQSDIEFETALAEMEMLIPPPPPSEPPTTDVSTNSDDELAFRLSLHSTLSQPIEYSRRTGYISKTSISSVSKLQERDLAEFREIYGIDSSDETASTSTKLTNNDLAEYNIESNEVDSLDQEEDQENSTENSSSLILEDGSRHRMQHRFKRGKYSSISSRVKFIDLYRLIVKRSKGKWKYKTSPKVFRYGKLKKFYKKDKDEL